jgi:hypothetical protein
MDMPDYAEIPCIGTGARSRLPITSPEGGEMLPSWLHQPAVADDETIGVGQYY